MGIRHIRQTPKIEEKRMCRDSQGIEVVRGDWTSTDLGWTAGKGSRHAAADRTEKREKQQRDGRGRRHNRMGSSQYVHFDFDVPWY